MRVHTFPSGPFETNAYVAACPDSYKAIIIDPGVDAAEPIKKLIEQQKLKPEKIVLTHSHWDHFGNAFDLKEFFNIPVYLHALDAENVRRPGSDGLPLFTSIKGFDPEGSLGEGDIIACGTLNFEVIETPGHSPGGVCLYDRANNVLFSGDTLFQGTIGNLSFPTSSPEKMWLSLKKLAKLPKNTAVYPGHGPQTTIGAEPWLDDAESLFS